MVLENMGYRLVLLLLLLSSLMLLPLFMAHTTASQQILTQNTVNPRGLDFALTFYSNRASILFNGTLYENGQSGSYSSGTYNVAWVVPPCPSPGCLNGYVFSGWSSTGGVQVENPANGETNVTVTASGTLKANFSSATTTPIYPLGALLAALIAAVIIASERHGRRYGKQSSKPQLHS